VTSRCVGLDDIDLESKLRLCKAFVRC